LWSEVSEMIHRKQLFTHKFKWEKND
jgi:hypothetical protein